MAVYLITYDLNREVVRPHITKKIKDTYPTWARLSESSYAVVTGATADQVHQTLKPLLDANDYLYVITLKKPYRGWGLKDVNEWLEQNLMF